jgi:dolichyl-phosphate-mannose-protein mannosyltransferase
MTIDLDTQKNKKFAIWGIAIVCAIAVFVRFWNLGNFNSLVFDEVYYAKFGNNYLTNSKFYNTHPPLSQYLIAIGIWLGDMLPIGRDNTNIFTGSLRSTFSYRWMNALFGSLIPPLVAALAYQLSQRLSYAFLAALFISLDGLFLVESRYALNGIYIVVFGVLGQLLVLIASRNTQQRLLLLALAGVSFGASAACKWNGLWFLLGMYILLFIAKLWGMFDLKRSSVASTNSLLYRLHTINPIAIFITLVMIPIVTYSLLWIPHLIQNPEPGFIKIHQLILQYHKEVGNGENIHPYCSDWYTWPLMMRSIAYYFTEYKPNHYYDVHAIGNPLLWWLALVSVFGSIWLIIKNGLLVPIREQNIDLISIPLFIVINYGANLLPWARVSRCLFLYHYVSAVLFAIMGLAWLVDNWLRSSSKFLQALGLSTIFSVAAAFIFWLPIYLGISIEKSDLHWRLWDFWIFNWI